MNIYIYWNSVNKDCKKIFHFMSPSDEDSIYSIIEEGNVVKLDRKFKRFKDKSFVMNNIGEADLIIFCTHGAENEILKYKNDPNRELEDITLIDSDNMEVLEDKIVLAFCCSSAKILGKKCVNGSHSCKTYLGFEKDIVYDDGRATRSRHLIYQSYKKAFRKSLEYAIITKCTVNEFRINLLQNMRWESAKVIFESQNHSLHNMYAGAIDGLVALGDIEHAMFV